MLSLPVIAMDFISRPLHFKLHKNKDITANSTRKIDTASHKQFSKYVYDCYWCLDQIHCHITYNNNSVLILFYLRSRARLMNFLHEIDMYNCHLANIRCCVVGSRVQRVFK